MPRLHAITIALDAIHFLPMQLATLHRLPSSVDWTWHVVEGVAAPVKDTAWVKPIPARLSRDGTTEFLNGLRTHPRVKVYQKQMWPGKTAMFNEALRTIREPGTLLQIDADEIWDAEQITKIASLFPERRNCARFKCVFYVGPNIITVGENCYGDNPGEWLRAWYFEPGMRFDTHEPPKIHGMVEYCMPKEIMTVLGLTFHHFAYCFESQVRFKEQYYGYKNAVLQWNTLQRNRQRPVKRLKDWLHWVDDRVGADLVYRK